MSLRMWRKNGPMISVEGRKGYFDVAYGQDSEAQRLDVFLPEGKGPFPAVISIHGGGYVACDKRQKEMIEPMLTGLRRGFAVIGLNYRLSGECRFPEPVRDIKRAIRFIKAHGEEWGICTERLILWGGSAGGYMTLMGCLCTDEAYFDSVSDPYKDVDAGVTAGVAWYPQTDFSSSDEELEMNSIIYQFMKGPCEEENEQEYEVAFPPMEETVFPMHNREDGACALFLGTNPGSGDEIVKTASPVYHIHKNMPPMLIQHGSRDQILPMEQSVRFAVKANRLCGEERVILDIIPGAIHSSVLFETEKNLERVFDFISRVEEEK